MKHLIDERYTFIAEDDWGDYVNGIRREPFFDWGGYGRHWYICTDGKGHQMAEHRAKWYFFNGDIPEGYEIDHIIPIRNGGTNKLSNLRMVTHKENCNNPLSIINQKNVMKGKMPSDKTIKTHIEKASRKVYQYTLDGKLIRTYNSISETRNYGFSFSCVARCASGERKTHKGFRWSYN